MTRNSVTDVTGRNRPGPRDGGRAEWLRSRAMPLIGFAGIWLATYRRPRRDAQRPDDVGARSALSPG